MCKFYKKKNNKQTKTKTKKLYQCSYLFFSFSLFLLVFSAAVIKAITACFPQATRHLKENAREHLRKNYTQPIVSEILSKIVDAGGLLNAKGLIVYNELEAELQQAFNASPYLLNKLLPKLKSKGKDHLMLKQPP